MIATFLRVINLTHENFHLLKYCDRIESFVIDYAYDTINAFNWSVNLLLTHYSIA